MSEATAFSAAALLIAVAFSCSTAERWLRRRRLHDAAWTVAMICFALGAAPFFLATETGWTPWLFRLFYLFGGVLTVPILALGTVYLLIKRRWANRLALVVALLSAFSAGVVLTAPLRVALVADRLNEGREVFGVLPRFLAAAGSGLGASVVIVGAVVSAARLLRADPHHSPAAKAGRGASPGSRLRLAGANALIAVGTLLISAKRPFVALSGSDEIGFAFALAVGLAVIFAGFLVASTPARRCAPQFGRATASSS